MSTYRVTVSNNDISISTSPVSYAIALSRTGSQGIKGDSVSSVALNENNDLIITVSTSSGEVVETFNLGALIAGINLDEIQDINTTGITSGQVIQYESETSTYVPHTLTTGSMTDVDNTNRADGSLLLYDGVSSKYKATNNLNNANTTIFGGVF